ncbi:MAG: DNA-binding MarR family transcriptional regulator, partial [Flavobacteriaceae bacterium]
MKIEEVSIDFDNSVGPWLGKTIDIINYHLLELFKENNLDITKEQMIVLKKLHDKDGISQNELALLIFRNKSSLTRLLSKMEKKNYILRKQSLEDKRINQVFLTEKGKDTYLKVKPIIKQMIDRLELNFSQTEKQQIIK